MAKLSAEKISQIQQLYNEIGVYSQVAKLVGCSAATVKKYCTAAATQSNKTIIPFSSIIVPIKDMNLDSFRGKRAELLLFTDCEQSEIERLWEEI